MNALFASPCAHRFAPALINGVQFGEAEAEAIFNAWLSKNDSYPRIFVARVMEVSTKLSVGGNDDVVRAKSKQLRFSMTFSRSPSSKSLVLPHAFFKELAKRRHLFLAKLEEDPSTKGQYEWILDILAAIH